MTMITPSYLGETIEYSSLHACRSTLEDPTHSGRGCCDGSKAPGSGGGTASDRMWKGEFMRPFHCRFLVEERQGGPWAGGSGEDPQEIWIANSPESRVSGCTKQPPPPIRREAARVRGGQRPPVSTFPEAAVMRFGHGGRGELWLFCHGLFMNWPQSTEIVGIRSRAN